MIMTARFRQGAGRLSLDFVRTLRRRGKPGVVEELPDPEALAAWVTQCGPVPATTPPDPALVLSAHELRPGVEESGWWQIAWRYGGNVLLWITIGLTIYSGLGYLWRHRALVRA